MSDTSTASGRRSRRTRRGPARLPGWLLAAARTVRRRVDRAVGGPGARRVILVLACVLAVNSADQGALGAIAVQVQAYFGITKTEFGALGSITMVISTLATLPFGRYVDRTTRTRLLAGAIVTWGLATIASGAATSFTFLLVARLVLGVMSAVAFPAVASLLGDYFPTADRGRIYGYVLSGELVGTGAGILLAGGAASVFDTWRAALAVLALPAFGVSWLVFRLHEPDRGGADSVDRSAPHQETAKPSPSVEPRQDLVLRRDPTTMSLASALRYSLRIPTNRILIIASALGYFFFAGLRYFGIEFAERHYGIGRSAALGVALILGVGALAGVLAGGRLADRLTRRGRRNARVWLPALTLSVAPLLAAPGIAISMPAASIGLLWAASLLLSSTNPPLDAARLDVMHPFLWGRAESVRTIFRGGLEAAAPISFGLVADTLAGAGARGLQPTLLVMLVPVLAGGLVLVFATRSYQRDVATAHASQR